MGSCVHVGIVGFKCCYSVSTDEDVCRQTNALFNGHRVRAYGDADRLFAEQQDLPSPSKSPCGQAGGQVL